MEVMLVVKLAVSISSVNSRSTLPSFQIFLMVQLMLRSSSTSLVLLTALRPKMELLLIWLAQLLSTKIN